MDLPLVIIISLVNYFISVDQKTQLRHRKLQDVGTIGLHHEVICYKIPSNAQVPLEFGDVLDGLGIEVLPAQKLVPLVISSLAYDFKSVHL